MTADGNKKKPPAIASGQRVEAGLDKKLADVFAPQGSTKGLGDFLVYDILRPNFQGLMNQIWHSIGDYIFGGRGNSYRRSYYSDYDREEPSYRYGGGRRNYARASESRREDSGRNRRSRRYDDTRYQVVTTPEDREEGISAYTKADEVKTSIEDWVDRYHSISISEVNGFLGFSDQDHTDTEWGWYDVSDLRIHTINFDKAEIIMPRPESLRD